VERHEWRAQKGRHQMTKIDFSQAARNNRKSNKPPRSKLQGIEKRSDDFSQGVTPECLIGVHREIRVDSR
jgi:hypothetical protein